MKLQKRAKLLRKNQVIVNQAKREAAPEGLKHGPNATRKAMVTRNTPKIVSAHNVVKTHKAGQAVVRV